MQKVQRHAWFSGAALALAAVFLSPAAHAQQRAQQSASLTSVAADTSPNLLAPAGCPNYTGVLDSISVPVNKSISLRVVIASAVNFDASFRLSSQNTAYVAAGDKVQGFLPVVTIPAGQTASNPFALFGVSVGATRLDIVPLSNGFNPSSFPAGAWDVNKSGGSSSKFVDANPPSASCRDSGMPTISSTGTVLASCGTSANGVASDGATQLLMRALSGLSGTACYQVTSSSSLDQGTIATPVVTTQPVSGLNYAFSLYKAPVNYGDSSNSRNVTVTFTFTPNVGNANTTSFTADLAVLRPPVVLMHGLWSSPAAWDSSFVRNDGTHTTVPGDYKSTNASRFSVNVPAVKKSVDNALKQFRANMNAGTQVDLVGHSMGGILGRLYANSAQNTRVDNYNLGDVHRIVTLDTPHWGSTLANLLISLRTVAPARVDAIGDIIGSVTQGAVCDLAENSPALQGLSATAVPGSALNASGGPFPLYRTAIENLLTANVCTGWSFSTFPPQCTSRAFLFPQDRVNGFRFQAANDQIVGLIDQQGGVGGQNFSTLIHTSVNAAPNVATAAFALLDGPASGLAATSFPAAQSTGLGNPAAPPRGVTGLNPAQDRIDYSSQCAASGAMNQGVFGSWAAAKAGAQQVRGRADQPAAPSPLVRVTAPLSGQRFAPGDVMTVNVFVDPSSNATDVVVGTPPLALAATTRLDVNNFQSLQTIPANFAGPLTITPIALDAQLNEIQGAPVTVNVTPATGPSQLSFAQKYYYIDPSVLSEQLQLRGTYSPSGIQIDLSSSVSGTTYVSSDPTVATVSADGLVTVLKAGIAVITGSNGLAKDFAVFVVENATSLLPPLNLTPAFTVQRGGFRLDRSTGFFVQPVVVTNTSNLPVPGSAYFILSGLPVGINLANKSGLTTTALPGSSFVTLPLSSDGRTLAPGQSTTLYLQFLNPTRASITYSSWVYRSSTSP